MGLVLIRRPSDTPTVDSFDDTRMFHYAVGGRRGVTKGYANECELTASGNALTIGAGEIIVDGWQSVVDSGGETISVGGVPTGAYISVYAEFNMTAADNPIVSIKTAYDTNTYPVISDGDDLISNPRGVARLVLWTCKKTASGVDTLTRVAGMLSLGKEEIAEINRRLDELGFKKGSIELGDGLLVARNDLYRLGKVVYAFVYVVDRGSGIIPAEFAPSPEFDAGDNISVQADGTAKIKFVSTGWWTFAYRIDDVSRGEDIQDALVRQTLSSPAGENNNVIEFDIGQDISQTICSVYFLKDTFKVNGSNAGVIVSPDDMSSSKMHVFPENDYLVIASAMTSSYYFEISMKRDARKIYCKIRKQKLLGGDTSEFSAEAQIGYVTISYQYSNQR